MKNIKGLEQLIKAEKQLYFKNWREKNKDKIKNYNKNYWEKRVKNKIKS